MKTLYITKKLISEKEISEIDYSLRESFGFTYDEFEEIVEIERGKPKWGPYTYPLKIDELIEYLQKSKDSGATHIELDYHEDHIGYEMATYRITKSSPIEIAEFEESLEEEESDRISRKRADLQRQLRELDN